MRQQDGFARLTVRTCSACVVLRINLYRNSGVNDINDVHRVGRQTGYDDIAACTVLVGNLVLLPLLVNGRVGVVGRGYYREVLVAEVTIGIDVEVLVVGIPLVLVVLVRQVES